MSAQRRIYNVKREGVGIATAVALMLAATGCVTSDRQYPGVVTTEPASSTQIVNRSSIADTRDPRNLVALATHIFTGQVQALAGTEALNSLPETQFAVTTGISLKGTVPNEVVVNQSGGTRKGVYYSVDGDKPFVVGQWYLFATRILKSKNWYTAIPLDGAVEIAADQARNKIAPPLARLVGALLSNPQLQIIEPPVTASPTLTFPTPSPGEENPPPASPPQPTS